MKNVIILMILAPQGFVNTTQFQESIVTVHQSGGVTQNICPNRVWYFIWRLELVAWLCFENTAISCNTCVTHL